MSAALMKSIKPIRDRIENECFGKSILVINTGIFRVIQTQNETLFLNMRQVLDITFYKTIISELNSNKLYGTIFAERIMISYF